MKGFSILSSIGSDDAMRTVRDESRVSPDRSQFSAMQIRLSHPNRDLGDEVVIESAEFPGSAEVNA